MPDSNQLMQGSDNSGQLTPYQQFMGWGGPGQPATWEQGMFGPTGSPTGEGPTAAQLALNAKYFPQPPQQQQAAPPSPQQMQQAASTQPAFGQIPPGVNPQLNTAGTALGQPPAAQNGMSPQIMQLLQYFMGQPGGMQLLQTLLNQPSGQGPSAPAPMGAPSSPI